MASHHPTIDPILPELRSALADLAPVVPKIPLISTVGQTNGAAPAFDADYWVANLRNPVRFSQAVAAAAENHATFIEVSPHPLLTHAIGGNLESARPRGDIQVAATLNRDNPETLTFHTYLATVRPPSAAMAQTAGSARRLADIPPTPWLHSKYWAAPSSANRQSASAHPLLGMHVEMPSGRDHVWQADVGTELIPWLADHKVHGQACHARDGFRRDGAGGRKRSPWLAGRGRGREPGRGRTDASPGRADAGDDAADPKRRRPGRTTFGSRSIHARPTAIGIGMRSPESR